MEIKTFSASYVSTTFSELSRTYQNLVEEAKNASMSSYSPYSKFSVGAAVCLKNGLVFSASNQENVSYPEGICAERNAVGSAIADGEREIKAIAIYSPNQKHCYPCGACRQVLNEFKAPEGLDVITEDENDELKISKLCELLPEGFNL